MSKKQLADYMKISPSKLKQLLNIDWYSELVPLGYSKKSKLLSPRIVKFVLNFWEGDEII